LKRTYLSEPGHSWEDYVIRDLRRAIEGHAQTLADLQRISLRGETFLATLSEHDQACTRGWWDCFDDIRRLVFDCFVGNVRKGIPESDAGKACVGIAECLCENGKVPRIMGYENPTL